MDGSMGGPRAAATSRLDSMGLGNAGAPSTGEGKQTFKDVHYRAADNPQQSCGTCQFFDDQGGCQLVAGNIDPAGTCDLFSPESAETPGQEAAEPQAAGPPAAMPPQRLGA